jgi:hypothetical protein
MRGDKNAALYIAQSPLSRVVEVGKNFIRTKDRRQIPSPSPFRVYNLTSPSAPKLESVAWKGNRPSCGLAHPSACRDKRQQPSTGIRASRRYEPNTSRDKSDFKKSTPWPETASELYRPSDRRLSAKLVPTSADRGCNVISVTDPYGRFLGFLDPRRYVFFQFSFS